MTSGAPQETYFRLMGMNGAAQLFRLARRLGVFDVLSRGPALPADVAGACGMRAEPAACLLSALHAIGLVGQEGARYRLTEAMALFRGPYADLGDGYWDRAEGFFRTGQALVAHGDPAAVERHYRNQAEALAWMLAPAAEEAAEILCAGGTGRELRVLDVGAGACGWSFAIAKRNPGCRVTAIDWPAVLEVAQAHAARSGLTGRFTALAGDYHRVEIARAAYDLVILANVAHLESGPVLEALLRRCADGLRPGGEVVVIDVFDSSDWMAAVYALGLAMRTGAGRVHRSGEMAAILGAAGFDAPGHTPLRSPPGFLGMMRASRAARRPAPRTVTASCTPAQTGG